MTDPPTDLVGHLLARLRQVRDTLGFDADAPADAETPLGDVLDSMAMVEFLALLSADCGVEPAAIEECVGRRFGTVRQLAEALQAAGLGPRNVPARSRAPVSEAGANARLPPAYLAATAVRLPDVLQPAADIDRVLQRPAGWITRRAGIRSRRLWAGQDPVAAAADAGRHCLDRAGLTAAQVGALLVTAEAPPLLAGLAAALHQRLALPPGTVALEIGGACTGFLAALWTARRLTASVGAVLIIAVEAHSAYLTTEPGPAGAAAALFGDGAAASLVCATPVGPHALALRDVDLGADGSGGALLRLLPGGSGPVELHMNGTALASRAIEAMAVAAHVLLRRHGLWLPDLRAVVAHGGNGRLPGMLARRLGVPTHQVWSAAPVTGNLGAASLPAAWELGGAGPGPVLWVGVGAGLTWGAALLG